MNCEEFLRLWTPLIDGTLAQDARLEMEQHAVRCNSCGAMWRSHDDLVVQVRAVVQVKSAETLAAGIRKEIDEMGRLPMAGASMESEVSRGEPQRPVAGAGPLLSAPVIAALFLGTLLGLFIAKLAGGLSGGNTLSEQLMMQMAFDSGMGMSRAQRMMMASGGFMSGGTFTGLPALNSAVKTLFCVMLIAGLTSQRLWESILASSSLPRLVYSARVCSLIVMVLGVVLVGFSMYIRFIVLPDASNRNSGAADMQWLMSAQGGVIEVWSIAFWAALFLLAFALIQAVLKNNLRGVR